MAKRTLLVGQSGGPTAVINASLAGVIAQARDDGFQRVLGMRHGVQGALQRQLVDLSDIPDLTLERLKRTPAAALGSCRYKLQDGDVERLVQLCRDESVDAWLYIGGNDSADTAHRVSLSAPELRVIGVPKTIDNDLPGTDHCPGYGSAARFVAQVTRETAQDTRAMRNTDPIRIIEVMGRHAGWLPGAAWLAKHAPDDAPHLVYVPERPRSLQTIVDDVREAFERHGWCVIVMCENQPEIIEADAQPRWVDAFGHRYFPSPAEALSDRLRSELEVRVRFDKPGTIQRNATAYVSATDRSEAELVGREAVRLAAAGESGVMVTLERQPGAYRIKTGSVSLDVVANEQRRLPDAYINATGNGMTQAFADWAWPLLGEPLPDFVSL